MSGFWKYLQKKINLHSFTYLSLPWRTLCAFLPPIHKKVVWFFLISCDQAHTCKAHTNSWESLTFSKNNFIFLNCIFWLYMGIFVLRIKNEIHLRNSELFSFFVCYFGSTLCKKTIRYIFSTFFKTSQGPSVLKISCLSDSKQKYFKLKLHCRKSDIEIRKGSSFSSSQVS